MTWSFRRDKKPSNTNKKRNRRAAAAGRRRPRFEELEKRELLAVLTVNSLNDTVASDAELTLREAISAVNALSTGGLSAQEAAQVDTTIAFGTDDTIIFDPALFAPAGQQTIALLVANGDLDITESVTITGPGPVELLITAGGNSRIFNIAASVGDVTLEGLQLSDGDPGAAANGGAIFSDAVGVLTIVNSLVTGNAATGGDGGAIYATGDLVLSATTVGGAGADANTSTGVGGGLYAAGIITIRNNSTVTGNTSNTSGGGIYGAGTVNIENSTVSNNTATNNGGGIFADAVNLTNSTVSGNTATTGDGGGIFASVNVTVNSSTVSGNTAGTRGGGIQSGGNVTVENSTIGGTAAGASNKAQNGDGGGILAADSVTIQNSTVAGNEALGGNSGGGVSAVRVTLRNTTVSGNRADFDGGGIEASDVTIQNSTIANNVADANTNAQGTGGGVSASNRFKMQNSIVVGNTDGTTDTNPDLDIPAAGASTVRFSLIGNNKGTPAEPQFTFTGPAGPQNAFGNFVGNAATPILPTAPAGTNSAFGSGAGANTLANNGGATATFALTTDSLALNTGKNSLSPAASLGDQRGLPFVRIFNGIVDMGAYEFQVPPVANPIPVLANPIPDQSAAAGVTFDFTFASNTFTDDDPLTYTAKLTSGANLPAWLSFAQGTNERRFTGIPPAADIGAVYSIRVTATDSENAMQTDDFLLTITATPVVPPPVVVALPFEEKFETAVVPALPTTFTERVPSFMTTNTGPLNDTQSLQATRPTPGARPVTTVNLDPALVAATNTYNVSVNVNVSPGNGTSFWSNAIVIFDYQNANNYKFAGLFQGRDQLIAGKVSNGVIYYSKAKRFVTQADTTYPISVTIDRAAGSVSVTSAGGPIVTHTYNKGITSGAIGVGTLNANARFDNFNIV